MYETLHPLDRGRRFGRCGQREGVTSPYPTLKQYLFSRTLERTPDDAVTLVRTDALERVRELKRMDGRAIWLCGGSVLAGDLHAAGPIDELILKVNPIVFGKGKPLFGRAVAADRWVLRGLERFESGHLIVNYRLTTRGVDGGSG